MSAISSAAMQAYSPLQRLQSTLASEVAAGNISSTDQSALSNSLSDIDSALQSQLQAGGARPSSEEMQTKINDLIASEVSEGDLTVEQAEELKNVFSASLQSGGPGGPGGPGGAGGPPPGPPPSGDEEEDDSSTSSTSSSTDVSELLQEFLKKLQEAQSANSTYGANGGSTASESQSLIVSFAA